MKKYKYLAASIVPLLALLTFNVTGILSYFGLFVIFGIIPLLELVFSPDRYNFTEAEKELAKEDPTYDRIMYLMIPLHFFIMYQFLISINEPGLVLSDSIARVLMMGIVLAFSGINLGHDLGHKTNDWVKQVLAQIMLTTAMQNHFVPYHNGGHHRDVATPHDLTSAREGDNYYLFAIKSQIGGYLKTWSLESKRLQALNKSTWLNPMILFTMLPLIMFAGIYYYFGTYATIGYFIAVVFGISILEAQNYFAHYGLRRKVGPDGRYERVSVRHSWNSDHIIGRVLFFELTRHSDHHHMGAKPFQILDSKEESPMLPYGYPAMLILSYLPFIFKPVMAKQLNKYQMA